MSKKERIRPTESERKRVRIALDAAAVPPAWNSTIPGVLTRVIDEHDKQPYTELLVVALRGGSAPEIYTFSGDRMRLLGILTWALDQLTPRLKG